MPRLTYNRDYLSFQAGRWTLRFWWRPRMWSIERYRHTGATIWGFGPLEAIRE